MENNRKEGKIKNVRFYLPKAFLFHTLKKEYLTPVLFVILLLLGWLTLYKQYQGITYLIVNFILFFISDICFSIYLVTYLRELKGEDCSLKSCLTRVGKRIHRIFILSIVYYLFFSVLFSVTLLNPLVVGPLMVIPVVVVYLVFMLNICYVLDLNYGVYESFSESKDTVDGYRTGIFRLALMFLFPVAICALFVLIITALSSNKYIFPVVLFFVYIVIRFMQRCKALLFYDIEYRHKNEGDEDDLE